MNPNTLFAATSSQNLWTDHPATATQRKRYGRTTQCDVLAFMLREAHAGSRALDLPDIMAAGIGDVISNRFCDAVGLAFYSDLTVAPISNFCFDSLQIQFNQVSQFAIYPGQIDSFRQAI